MVQWAAANVSESPSKRANDADRKSSETVEAALARLTKAYSTAMSCLGAMHKLELATGDPMKQDEIANQSKKLATAARTTFERGVLLDPLIANFCPTWTKVVTELAQDSRSDDTWSFLAEQRPEPAVLTSASHKNMVNQIAYLSLLNYADLLVASQRHDEHNDSGILEKGVVKHFSLVGWTEDFNQQLALVALCDACDLDGSDPVVWLKLACAARRYSRILGGPQLKYKRLERHALEMGTTALPRNVPPNRTILRALQEHEELPDIYSDSLREQSEEPAKLMIDLPRYSWSILGRMLIRACREGLNPNAPNAFGSPCIELHLSPMLVLPERSLGVICNFLENEDIWSFEATCRGLSATILSARASLERKEAMKKSKVDEIADTIPTITEKLRSPASLEPSSNPTNDTEVHENEQSNQSSIPAEPSRSRSSKRVLSQLITSGKRAERDSKRESVQFCLLASILHCTIDDIEYQKVRGKVMDGESINDFSLGSTFATSRGVPKFSGPLDSAMSDPRLGDSCLTEFVTKWNSNNSGPFDMLNRYVAHVALNVGEVFSSDQDSLALSSFIVDCVDLLAKKAGMCYNLDLCSFGRLDLRPGGVISCIEYLAVNLLSAELRLKRSDGQLLGHGDYHSDSNYVAVVMPELLSQVTVAESDQACLLYSKLWISLKTRLNWLAVGFYLERSRQSQDMLESRSAEKIAIDNIEKTIACLALPRDNPVLTVPTPHLTSPRRIGSHWKSLSVISLNAFRDYIQASSVVSGARQQFVEKLADIESYWQLDERKCIQDSDVDGLLFIGKTLVERYDVPYRDEGGKHEELLDDFIALCEDDLSIHFAPPSIETGPESRWGALWALLPSGKTQLDRIIEVSNPSILTILMTCLNNSEENRLLVVNLLTRLVIFSFEFLGVQRKGMKTERANTEDEFDYMSDDEGHFSDDENDDDGPQRRGSFVGKGNTDQRKDKLVAVAAEFFIDKLAHLFQHNLSDSERQQYATSSDCIMLIKCSMAFVSTWYQPRGSRRSTLSTGEHDLRTFLCLTSLRKTIARTLPSTLFDTDTEVAFFVGLSQVIIRQRYLVHLVLKSGNDSRSGRGAKQKEYLGRVELIGTVASELAVMLSRHLSSISGGKLNRSKLLSRVLEATGIGDTALSFAALIEAMLYLWNIIPRDDAPPGGSVLGRISSETLLVPLAASIIAICGSAVHSRSGENETTKSTNQSKLSLSQFLDSDASANERDSDEEDVRPSFRSRQHILQPLCQAVQCISLIVEAVDERLVVRYRPKTHCDRDVGHMFPLVSTRVLSSQADLLLSEFGGKPTIEENLWQTSYPYGTRAIGLLLDSALHKLYKYLYGFTIHAGHDKDKSSDDKSQSIKRPESTKAAAQLYRCIQRAYSESRKSVPKGALECVLLALPEESVSPSRDVVRNFLFKKDTVSTSPEALSRIFRKDFAWEETFRSCYMSLKEQSSERDCENFKNDIMMIRKGIARQLAQASLPAVSQAGPDNAKVGKSDDQQIAEERSMASFQERELSKKFSAIIDAMCYGDTSGYQGWLAAAECITLKAELVADRLGSSLGYVRSGDFSISKDVSRAKTKLLPLEDLKKIQEREYAQSRTDWIAFIGNDTSIYVDYQWTSFSSLEDCAQTVAPKYRELTSKILSKALDSESSEFFEAHVWNHITTMYNNDDLIGWQQAWGGMFVEALRTIASRCLCMGYFLLGINDSLETSQKTSLQAEVLESLGILKYTELMGSQVFGYPMRILSDYKKRELADVARQCFQEAVDKVAADDNQVTYDLLFMVGKCHEKSAKTFRWEAYPVTRPNACQSARRSYTRSMEKALDYYKRSLDEATVLEEEGALPDVQGGGSSHGKTEPFYRLHASRLKCLISAVQYPENVRDQALDEAAALTSRFWYDQSFAPDGEDKTDAKQILWKVLADVVAALSQCRLDHHFFHRSVYRYAQALMWAPALHDPESGLVNGSLGLVPATKSHIIRGLNSSTACVNSAEVILAPLFERKRPQIVSVWVTNPNSSPSPFEAINSSTRKFDSLRGKYLYAYIETLRLCKRSHALEALFQQVANSKRDLPSFYQASALTRGNIPESMHVKDNLLKKMRPFHTLGLLRDVKRIINRALADIILKDMEELDSKGDELKKCYACYLRLNSSIEDIEKMRSWKYGGSALPEVEALCKTYLLRPESRGLEYESSNWSGGSKKLTILKAAIAKCFEMFPMLAISLYKKSKPKRPASKVETNVNDDAIDSDLRKDSVDSLNVQQFVVDVPSGLNVGDKFETTVQIGNQTKTLRLTVPEGLPPKLKFSLNIPKERDNPPAKKQRQE